MAARADDRLAEESACSPPEKIEKCYRHVRLDRLHRAEHDHRRGENPFNAELLASAASFYQQALDLDPSFA